MLTDNQIDALEEHMKDYINKHYPGKIKVSTREKVEPLKIQFIEDGAPENLDEHTEEPLPPLTLLLKFPRGVNIDRVLELKNEAKAYAKREFQQEIPASQINTDIMAIALPGDHPLRASNEALKSRSR